MAKRSIHALFQAKMAENRMNTALLSNQILSVVQAITVASAASGQNRLACLYLSLWPARW
jgi:hypothetical protein